jgi:hypothetical protein
VEGLLLFVVTEESVRWVCECGLEGGGGKQKVRDARRGEGLMELGVWDGRGDVYDGEGCHSG